MSPRRKPTRSAAREESDSPADLAECRSRGPRTFEADAATKSAPEHGKGKRVAPGTGCRPVAARSASPFIPKEHSWLVPPRMSLRMESNSPGGDAGCSVLAQGCVAPGRPGERGRGKATVAAVWPRWHSDGPSCLERLRLLVGAIRFDALCIGVAWAVAITGLFASIQAACKKLSKLDDFRLAFTAEGCRWLVWRHQE